MKHLGKRPPENVIVANTTQPICYMELAEHFRQSLIEAADELDGLMPRFKGMPEIPMIRYRRMCDLIRMMRTSAGVEEK